MVNVNDQVVQNYLDLAAYVADIIVKIVVKVLVDLAR